MAILFLDNDHGRHRRMRRNSIGLVVVPVFSAKEAIAALEKAANAQEPFDLIMLDHDLDTESEGILLDDAEDGRFVALWMAQDGRHKKTPVIIHSLHDAARDLMESILVGAGFEKVAQLPGAWTMIEKGQNGEIVFNPSKPRYLNDQPLDRDIH